MPFTILLIDDSGNNGDINDDENYSDNDLKNIKKIDKNIKKN